MKVAFSIWRKTHKGSLQLTVVSAQRKALPKTYISCDYYTSELVHNLANAMKSDRARFAKYFHGMVELGIYLAPSKFEAGFLSTANTMEDIANTVSAASESFRESV